MRPGTFAAIYAFEPVLFPVEVDNRQVLHATVGILKHTMCHENHFIDAIQPCRAGNQTASVATNSTARQDFCMSTAGLSGALHSQQPPLRLNLKSHSCALAAKPAGIETKCEAAVVSVFCRTGKHSSAGYEALAALARRRRSHFEGKQEAAKRLRSRPPFSAFHKDCFAEYVAHGLSEQAGMPQLALLYVCNT